MSPRDLAFCALLIALVRFSMASIIRPQRLFIVRHSPESARTVEDIPDRWRTVHPKFKAPQIEIQFLKGPVSRDENWITNEYKYSGKDYQYVYRRCLKIMPKDIFVWRLWITSETSVFDRKFQSLFNFLKKRLI